MIEQLRETPVFGALADEELEALAVEAETLSLRTGATVVEQGESSQGIYVLVSGRLRAFGRMEDGTELVLGDIASGELMGEMEVISPAPRVATVRAVRDSRLLYIKRETFARIVHANPAATLGVARVLVERLDRANRQRRSSTRHRTISIVPVGGPCSQVIEQLAAHLAEAADADTVRRDDVDAALGEDPTEAQLDQWLHRREAAAHMVVYVAAEPGGSWARRCVQQADRVVAIDCSPDVATGNEVRRLLEELNRAEWGPAVDVVCVQSPGSVRAIGADIWKDATRSRLHHYRPDSAPDLVRIGRALLGRDIGVVLSGGGARGMSHIGVLRAFEESGIPVDLIGGSSFGGIVAFLKALSLEWKGIRDVLWETVARPGAPIDPTIPAIAISKGERLRHALTAAFGDARIEDAWIKCFCMASNLSSGEPVVMTEGSMVEALRASVAIPGVFPPVATTSGHVLVDGGIMNNLPVNVMAEMSNGGPIVAVNLRHPVELAAQGLPEDGIMSGWRLLGRRLRPFGFRPKVPSMIELLARANETAGAQATRMLEQSADFVLHPPKGGHGFLEFGALDDLIESGYRYTMEQLEGWQAAGRSLIPAS